MINTRIASAVLAGVFLLGLTACGSDSETETAAPAATTAAEATTAAAEATSAAADPATTAASGGNADTVTCEQANKAAESFKKAVLTLAQSGAAEISPADAKAMLEDFATQLTKATEGASPELAAAVKANADAATKAAAAKDPGSAMDSPENVKAGQELNAACKAAGVETNF
ncbi:hypothetical protein [Actinoplanes sp. NPDC023714]|uniref:hypothetical protein n=1 Tax=Actinoplanes sp. NPDC023714 TaxID=3154322 RepID=UPI0033CD3A80